MDVISGFAFGANFGAVKCDVPTSNSLPLSMGLRMCMLRSFLQSTLHPFQSRYYMCRSNRTFLSQCVCWRFGRGEVSRLTDVLQRAETEVERRLNDVTREFIWWMTSVCLL